MTGRKSKYPWKLMLMLYVKGRYTLSDISHIFGAVEGHISKKFAEKGVNARTRGKLSMQVTPRAFPAELHEEIRNVDSSGKLLESIDKYYRNVCLPLKAAEVLRLKEQGVSDREIARKYGIGRTAVGDLRRRFEGYSPVEIRQKVSAIKSHYKKGHDTKQAQ